MFQNKFETQSASNYCSYYKLLCALHTCIKIGMAKQRKQRFYQTFCISHRDGSLCPQNKFWLRNSKNFLKFTIYSKSKAIIRHCEFNLILVNHLWLRLYTIFEYKYVIITKSESICNKQNFMCILLSESSPSKSKVSKT